MEGRIVMRPPKRIILAMTMLIVISITIYLVVLALSTFPDVPVNDLLISNPNFPLQWNTGELPVQLSSWSQEERKHNFALKLIQAQYETSRTWCGNDKSVCITETVFLFKNTLEAAWVYWLREPEKMFAYKWPNFESTCSDCYSNNWQYHNLKASQEHVVCAMGGPGSCQLYYYWVRYGQYSVLVELSAANQGANERIFEAIVGEINEWANLKFQSK